MVSKPGGKKENPLNRRKSVCIRKRALYKRVWLAGKKRKKARGKNRRPPIPGIKSLALWGEVQPSRSR